MKRPSSLDLDSLAGDGKGRPFAICPSGKEERDGAGTFQSILDGAGDEEEEILVDGDDPCSPAAGDGRSGSLALGEKKRRLSAGQVKALERNFEVENKLEPERKVKLAQELGLQPRQVAIWFQNRRARWKTKQLERDYGLLKAEYDALKVSYDGLHRDKDALLAEIKELKAKLAMGGEENCCSVKEEAVAREGLIEQMRGTSNSPTQQNFVKDDDEEDLPALIYKDGLSDSDSSAILNEESSSPSSGIPSLPPQLQEQQQQQLPEFAVFSCDSPASSSPFHFANEEGIRASCYYYERRSVEDEEFLAGEELCGGSGFLADEQPLSPYWCYSDQWN